MDGANDAGLERLDDLGPACWYDLALRRGDNIDGTEARPENGDKEKGDQRPGDSSAKGRGRCLDDFQGGMEKLDLRDRLVQGARPKSCICTNIQALRIRWRLIFSPDVISSHLPGGFSF